MKVLGYLKREDIVGKSIQAIYHAPWYIEPDGFGGRSSFIRLETGDVFRIQSQDPSYAYPIARIELAELDASPTSEKRLTSCIGETIIEVLACDCWPSFGLLLANGYLLYSSEFANTNQSNAILIDLDYEPIGTTYTLEDVVPYWQQPLP